MPNPSSFESVISLWPSLAELAKDIGVDVSHAQTMKTRDSIPSRFWGDLEDAARRRGISEVTAKQLSHIEAKLKKEKRARTRKSRKSKVISELNTKRELKAERSNVNRL